MIELKPCFRKLNIPHCVVDVEGGEREGDS